jgi:uncharacterized protein
MRRKQVDATAGATDLGLFTAIAAAYTIDRDGERIRPGAFRETIRRWQASGRRLPLHWAHSGEARDIIGLVDPSEMRETPDGLYVEGRVDIAESEVAREAWRSMKADAVALSFGFMVTDEGKDSDGVRELREIDLFEISIVPNPANQDTRILSTKATDRSWADDLGWKLLRTHEDLELRSRAGEFDQPVETKATEPRKSIGPIKVQRFEC